MSPAPARTASSSARRCWYSRSTIVVAGKRATFTHANVLAEVHRQLHGARFATPTDRLEVADVITSAALGDALQLTPPELEPAVPELRRADGTSKLRHRGAEKYTTREIFEAESRLLEAGRTTGGPGVPADVVAEVAAAELPGREHRLGPDQAAAVAAIATSGRVLDVLVGPAGTGKTVSLAGLREAWERTHGAGSVTGGAHVVYPRGTGGTRGASRQNAHSSSEMRSRPGSASAASATR